jgi:hypothetical protein
MTIKQQGGIFGRNPTFNDVDVEGTLTVNGEPISDFGTMAQQDANSVNIDGGAIDGTIIGANSATSASFTTIDSAEATYGITDAVAFSLKGRTSTFGTNAIAELSIQSGATSYYNGALVVKVTPNYNSNAAEEVARFTSGGLAFVDGKGIDFSATSDATGSTSELFDDYEEGSWTPTPTQSAFVSPTGSYVKIGKTVFASFELTGFNTTLGNFFEIRGLPYAASGAGQNVGSLGYIDNGVTDYIFRVLSGTPRINVYNSSGVIYRYNTISNYKIAGAVVYETT